MGTGFNSSVFILSLISLSFLSLNFMTSLPMDLQKKQPITAATLPPETPFTLKSEEKDIIVPLKILRLSEKLKGYVEDFQDNKVSIPIDDMSFKTTGVIFDFLKSYDEQNESLDVISQKVSTLSFPDLVDVANGANNLLLSHTILECIGNKVMQSIGEIQNFNKSDYDVVDNLNPHFFTTYVPITSAVINGIKTIIMQREANKRGFSFDLKYDPSRSLHEVFCGCFFDDESIVLARDRRGGRDQSSVSIYTMQGKKISEQNINYTLSSIASKNGIIVLSLWGNTECDQNQVMIINKPLTDKKICILEKEGHCVNGLALNSNGKYLASFENIPLSGGKIYVWDVGAIDWAKEKPILPEGNKCQFTVDLGILEAVSFISDKKLLVVGGSGDIRLLNVTIDKTQDGLKSIIADTKSVDLGRIVIPDKIAFSSDGNYFVFAYKDRDMPHTIVVFDTKNNKIVTQWQGEETVFSLCFSTDNNWIVCGGWDKILIYDTFTGALLCSLNGLERHNIVQFGFNDKKLLAMRTNYGGISWNPLADKRVIEIWDVVTDQEDETLKKVKKYIPSKVAFLYRSLYAFKNNKRALQSGADNSIFSSLDITMQSLLKRVGLVTQSWREWLQNLSWKQKATIGVGGAALGYVLYKYITQSKK